MEFDFHTDLDIDGLPILKGRLKTPLPHGLDCFCVETQAQTSNHLDVSRMPCGVDNHPENAGALLLGPTCFLGIVRIGRRDRLRCGDPSTNFINSATDAAAHPGKLFERKLTIADGSKVTIQSGPPGLKYDNQKKSLSWDVPPDFKSAQMIQVIMLVTPPGQKPGYVIEKVSVL